jgi:hypothetical protein
MDIGEEEEKVVVEPIEDPVTTPAPEHESEPAPVRIPAKTGSRDTRHESRFRDSCRVSLVAQIDDRKEESRVLVAHSRWARPHRVAQQEA